MRQAVKYAVWGGGLLLVGCGGGSLPEASPGGGSSEVARGEEASGASQDEASSEMPPTEGPCPDVPQAEVVVAQAERAHELSQEIDEYVRQLGRPPKPSAPYTVKGAERWIAQVGQRWFDTQTKRVAEFEKRLEEFPEGTFAHGRATISVAGAWDYLSKRRTTVPKYAEKKYDVRVVYFGDWPRYQDQPLSEHAQMWRERARSAASEWGMFQVGVDRSWLTGKAGEFLRDPFPPPAIVDRALLMWVEDFGEAPARVYDQARVAAWFEKLPAGDLSRRRLALNLLRGYGSQPQIDDLGPPEKALPQAEQRTERTNIEGNARARRAPRGFPLVAPALGAGRWAVTRVCLPAPAKRDTLERCFVVSGMVEGVWSFF